MDKFLYSFIIHGLCVSALVGVNMIESEGCKYSLFWGKVMGNTENIKYPCTTSLGMTSSL